MVSPLCSVSALHVDFELLLHVFIRDSIADRCLQIIHPQTCMFGALSTARTFVCWMA
jgi:hypothetical protein